MSNLPRLKLAVKNIDKFDGSQDFDTWIRGFEAMLDAFVVENSDRYEALVMVLDPSVVSVA